MPFSHFEHVDRVLAEPRELYLRRDGSVWPSEASAPALQIYGEDHYPAAYFGKCHRAAFLSMAAFPVTNPIGPTAVRRFHLGSAVELDNIEQAIRAGIFAASQVKRKKKLESGIVLPIVLDLVEIDPETKQGVIVEMKSIYGYTATSKVIKKKRPKPENMMQLAIYLDQVKDGKTLKEYIRLAVADLIRDLRLSLFPETRAEILEEHATHVAEVSLRRLAEVWKPLRDLHAAQQPTGRISDLRFDLEKVLSMDDGPIAGKLAYETRDSAVVGEMDIGLMVDEEDGKTYPTLNGYPYRVFSLDSVYERYELLTVYWEKHWNKVQQESERMGLGGPTAPLQELIKISQRLAPSNMPPAEFEYRYKDDKVNDLFSRGAIGKTKYAKWQKGKQTLGDWNCSYCAYSNFCIPIEYPDLRMVIRDLGLGEDDIEDEAAA